MDENYNFQINYTIEEKLNNIRTIASLLMSSDIEFLDSDNIKNSGNMICSLVGEIKRMIL